MSNRTQYTVKDIDLSKYLEFKTTLLSVIDSLDGAFNDSSNSNKEARFAEILNSTYEIPAISP